MLVLVEIVDGSEGGASKKVVLGDIYHIISSIKGYDMYFVCM